jgi:hypothetical protein
VPYPTSGAAADHGSSIKNPATYEALINQGKSKAQAAAISNAALAKGHRKGAHRLKKADRGRKGPRRARSTG